MSHFTIEFESINKKKDELSFIMKGNNEYGLDKSIINSIRRTLLSDIPTVAFRTDDDSQKDITIHTNNTPLHNEFLSHRISLIPLYIDPKTFHKSYLFQLQVKHDKHELYQFVTTGDFEIFPLQKDLSNKLKDLDNDYLPDDPDYITQMNQLDELLSTLSLSNYDLDNPLSTKEKETIFRPFEFRKEKHGIFITELKNTNDKTNTQELYVYGSPSISTAREHSRWQAVSCANYSFVKDEQLFLKVLQDKLQVNNIDPDKHEEYSRDLYLSESERYYLRDKQDEPYVYNFKITSVHYYESKYLFLLSCEILIDKLNNIKDNCKHLLVGTESCIDISKQNEYVYHFIIHNEDDTLGNILQSHISKMINEKDLIQVCGYKKVHPLEEKINVIISINPKHKSSSKSEQQKVSDIITYIISSLDQLLEIYETIHSTAEKQL